MSNNQPTNDQNTPDQGKFSNVEGIELHSISFPKGGGALKGIDEKFKVNPVNGSANFSIPLPLSPGRNGFTPSIGLNYNSGSGNGPFGLGWQLGIPSIQIKTDKALPTYTEQDVYLFSEAEDLVPYYKQDNQGNWIAETDDSLGIKVTRYRPRIESAHAKIEKIDHPDFGTYWMVTSRNNTITFYGKSESARVFDPNDPKRIFKWLAEFSFDNKGNWIKYEYKKENLENVPNTLSEKHRWVGFSNITNAYVKRIKYGNKKAYYADSFTTYEFNDPTAVEGLDEEKHCFELVFDYGEHHNTVPTPHEELNTFWDYRADTFSSYRSGFEIRTNRLCKRVLMYHKFTELGQEPYLVKSVDFVYEASNINDLGQSETTYLKSAIQKGFIKKQDGSYSEKSLPAMVFDYQNLHWSNEIKEVNRESLQNVPSGLTNNYQWVDLYGEGISGILTEHSDCWYYKQNLGNPEGEGATFSPLQKVASIPSTKGLNNGVLALQDLEANGQKQIVVNSLNLKGFYSLDTKVDIAMELEGYIPFKTVPNRDWKEPNTRFIDLNGDGKPELVVSEENAFLWYENLGREGYGLGKKISKPFDEDMGPAIVFADSSERIYLADFSGDGLTDIVRIRNGEVCYWPNLGYGHFGAKVTMENAPVFDFPQSFNPDYLHLADISGTGATDIIYLGQNSFKSFINLSGNAWSPVHEIEPFFPINNHGKLSVIDLLGSGTSCLVWSSDVPGQHPMRYIDLMSGRKPHLLIGYSNGMGKEVSISYQNSTYFYLKDKSEGTPWITKLPFPVQVIEKTTVKDHISSSELSTSFSYHHGYYDHEEREFRGFGRVDQTDHESFETYKQEDELDMPPKLTKTWIHTGSYRDQEKFSRQYQDEYYTDDAINNEFPDSILEDSEEFSYQEFREAIRGLKGATLRQEIYTLDGHSEKEGVPYAITETNFTVRQLQPHLDNPFGVYQSLGRETLTYTSERNTNDPRIGHQFALAYDEFGHLLQSLQVAYPRKSGNAETHPEQLKLYATLQEIGYENETINYYRLGLPVSQKQYQINGFQLSTDAVFSFDEVTNQLMNVIEAVNVLQYQEEFTSGVQAKCIGIQNTIYKGGSLKSLALLDYAEQLVMTESMALEAYDGKAQETFFEKAGYVKKDESWWVQSDKPSYLGQDDFYLPYQNEDTFGNTSTITFDEYRLAAIEATDALGNSVFSEIDYRTLSVKKMTDINDTVSEAITDELGMVIATTVYGTEEGVQKGDVPIENYTRVQNSSLDDIVSNPLNYLQEATTYFYYYLEPWETVNLPPHFVQLQRETHVSELGAGEETAVQISLGYSDGFGRELQSKIKHSENQWLVSGRTVYNNKEKPVKQYEPFFSDTHVFQSEEEIGPVGVTPILYYDPLGRLIKTETPDGFHSRVAFDPWRVITYDQNDTVLDSVNYAEHSTLPSTDPKKKALDAASPHYNTPSTVILDSLGREFRVEQLKEEGGAPLVTHTEFDILGNAITQTDPRQFTLNQSRGPNEQVYNFSYTYDLVGNVLRTVSQDAGTTYNLINVKGNPLFAWNARDYRTEVRYDALHRPMETLVEGPDLNIMAQKISYGTNRSKNQNGQPIVSYDPSGKSENLLFDFKGQVLHSTKQICADYKSEPNWTDETTVVMEPEVYASRMDYDALGRVIKSILPDGSVHLPQYHHIGWLKGMEVKLRGTEFGTESTESSTVFIEDIAYDAKGQRTQIQYGNGVTTQYEYDEKTFRLNSMLTNRQETNGAITELQNIEYVYDPIGNIIQITDNSHERVFHAGQQVNPTMNYVYDALYQLKQATGREHLALLKNSHQQHNDIFKETQFTQVNNTGQLGNYSRNYDYDDSGNLIQIQHTGTNSFTRNISPSQTSNKAISDESDTTTPVESYFDAAGNLLQLEHLANISWNYRNNIASATIVERQVEDENGQLINVNDAEYYVYDGSGQRTRKVKETYNSSGDLLWTEEKIYLGGVEIKHRFQGNNKTLRERRSSVHVMDDTRRIALVYYWETSNDSSVTTLSNKTHYQMGNHLGSASLELDGQGQLISYEEYYPFGGTAFTAGESLAEVKLKEYKYTGKERDNTTGLYYYGARYYAPWLGRWLNPDPAGTVDGLNLFRYVSNNPLKFIDPDGKGETVFFNQDDVSKDVVVSDEPITPNYKLWVDSRIEYIGNQIVNAFTWPAEPLGNPKLGITGWPGFKVEINPLDPDPETYERQVQSLIDHYDSLPREDLDTTFYYNDAGEKVIYDDPNGYYNAWVRVREDYRPERDSGNKYAIVLREAEHYLFRRWLASEHDKTFYLPGPTTEPEWDKETGKIKPWTGILMPVNAGFIETLHDPPYYYARYVLEYARDMPPTTTEMRDWELKGFEDGYKVGPPRTYTCTLEKGGMTYCKEE